MSVQRLYQRQGAGRPLRVRWALEEAGAPYEYIVLTQDEGRSDDHAARHPLKRVPVLETDAGTLFESAALCLQIADLYPDAGLIPATRTHARGEVYQWAFFAMIVALSWQRIRAYTEQHADEPDAEQVAKAVARLAKAADAVARALDETEYLVEGRFTIADVADRVTSPAGAGRTSRRPDAGDRPYWLRISRRLDAREAKQRAYAA